MTSIELFQAPITSLRELYRAVRQPESSVPVVVPVYTPLTEAQREALQSVPSTYPTVVPLERRDLTTTEVKELARLRADLDHLDAIVEAGKKRIRTAVLNAMDVRRENSAQEANPEADLEDLLGHMTRDKEGHYVEEGVKDTIEIPGTNKVFSWEPVEGAPTITVEDLRQIADDPTEVSITHEDYLAMTDQVRVVNEAKVLELLKKRPELLGALSKVTKPGTIRGSLYIRNRK